MNIIVTTEFIAAKEEIKILCNAYCNMRHTNFLFWQKGGYFPKNYFSPREQKTIKNKATQDHSQIKKQVKKGNEVI